MNKTHIFGLFLLITGVLSPLQLFAGTPLPEESAQDILRQAIAKYETNTKGIMYKTDTAAEFTKVHRATMELYFGIVFPTATTTNQIEMLRKADIFSKIATTKNATEITNSYGTTETYINGQKLPAFQYFNKTSKYFKGNLVETYESTQKALDKNNQNIVNSIGKKLRAKGVPEALVKKVENKLYTSQNIKFTKNETLSGLDAVLGLAPDTSILSSVNPDKIENDLSGTLASILEIRQDLGSSVVQYDYAPNVWKDEFLTKVYNTRKLVIGFNTDTLANLAIQKNAQSSLTLGLAVNISNEEFKQVVKNLYQDFTIEIDIDTQTYDIRQMYIPKYEISIPYQGTTAAFLVEATIKEAPTGLKTITLPTKFTTPKIIRGMYLKY